VPKRRAARDSGYYKVATEVKSRRPWVTQALAALSALAGLGGCGLSVPDIKEVWQGADATRKIEFEIKKRVYCDLKNAIAEIDKHYTYQDYDERTGITTTKQFLPEDWGVQISLLLQVDESTSFNPGVALTTPFANGIARFSNGNVTIPQSFSLGLGTTASSISTRIDKFNPFYTVSYLRIPDSDQSLCKAAENDPVVPQNEQPQTGSFLLQSELGISKWLQDAIFVTDALKSNDPSGSPNKTPDTVSVEIKFVVTTNANINPVWKLLPITVNNGALSLFTTGRIRTHDLLITVGPQGTITNNASLAGQIGQAVSNSSRVNFP
jgi:hypothetical protein